MIDSQMNCVAYRRFFSRNTTALLLCASSLLSCAGSPDPIDVTLSFDQPLHSLSAAVFTVNYLTSGAKPLSPGGVPACFALHPGMTAGFSDDGNGKLTVRVSSTTPFSTPLDLAACRMLPLSDGIDHRAVAHGLRVAVHSATSSDGRALEHSELARGDKGNRRMASGDSPRGPAGKGAATSPRPTGLSSSAGSASSPAAGSRRESNASQASASSATRAAASSSAAASDSSVGGNAGNNTANNTDSARRQATRDWQHEAEADRLRAEEQRLNTGGRNFAGGDNSYPGQNDPEQNDPGPNDDGQANDNQPPDDAQDDDPAPPPADPVTYELRLAVTTSGVALGALQFELRHLGASGGFVGRGGSVECNGSISGAMATFNNVGNGKIKGAIIDIDGFPVPSEIATCSFRTSEDLLPGSFDMTVIEATDADLGGNGQSLDPFPGMAVVDVRELN
ncbi:MAG: hypothetical protein ABGY28_13310 [bacterium]